MTECPEPNCGSKNTEFMGWDGYGGKVYYCKECGRVWVEEDE